MCGCVFDYAEAVLGVHFFGQTSEITFVASRYHKAIKSTVDEKQFQATYDEEAFSEVKR